MKRVFKFLGKLLAVILILLVIALLGHILKEDREMKNITGESKLCAVYRLPELKPLKNYLMYMKNGAVIRLGSHFMPINQLDPNGNALYGLERVRAVMKDGATPISIYSEEECGDDPEKKNANILFFPSLVEDSGKPFVIVIAGGGYAAVSSLLESYPTARWFNELGYPVFVLNYRIDSENGLFPKPMEDLAQALHYIDAHHGDFGLEKDHPYIVGGFSAGGHITAEWGTDNEGYLKYGLRAPHALFLGYAAISPKYFVSEEKAEAMAAFRENIVGKDNYDEQVERFSADQHVHADYPPAYIVYCADDDMVDPTHSKMMIEALDQYGVKHAVEEGEQGGHGFAVGLNTSVEGWIDRADVFFRSVIDGSY